MISVLGGAGFIGTKICTNLASKGIKFEILDLKISGSFPKYSKKCDIRSLADLRKTVSGKTIINLAAVHKDDVRDHSLYYTTNVKGTENICQVADEKGIKSIVFTSTVAVFGFAKAETDEQGKINPFNDYGKSKFQAEEVLRRWYKAAPDDRSLTIVRPTVVFGEGNRGNVFNLLEQISKGRFVMIGKGDNRKSMAYVENIAAFLEQISSHSLGYKLVNYIDKPDLDMNSLVLLVNLCLNKKNRVGLRIPYWCGLVIGLTADGFSRVSGKDLPISLIRVRKFCSTTTFSSLELENNDFVPPYTLKEGLMRTLEAEFLKPDPEREIFNTE